MSYLISKLDEYVRVRRLAGAKLIGFEQDLKTFFNFLESAGITRPTPEAFERWREEMNRNANNITWKKRLGYYRTFATWHQSIDGSITVPSLKFSFPKSERPKPHIYSEEEFSGIVSCVEGHASPYGLESHTLKTLVILIYLTGLRIGEALALDINDVDMKNRLLQVRSGKFGGQRVIPVSSSVIALLRAYILKRDKILDSTFPFVFANERGARYDGNRARVLFAQFTREIGLRSGDIQVKRGRGPRIHDLRHTFAVRSLIQAYENGADMQRHLHKLSIYLGHTKIATTYWYIEAVPQLQRCLSRLLEAKLGEGN